MGNKGPLKVLNGTKLILDDHGKNLDSFIISLESFRSFRGPLLLKPITGQEVFFAVSYSKQALVHGQTSHPFILGNEDYCNKMWPIDLFGFYVNTTIMLYNNEHLNMNAISR